ncbi:MAG: rhomboid family intramembrane serine protease [Anaerolineae bacterium]|nr:rhomboid family intramembrane serine protease [Anaerolineae bacterium]
MTLPTAPPDDKNIPPLPPETSSQTGKDTSQVGQVSQSPLLPPAAPVIQIQLPQRKAIITYTLLAVTICVFAIQIISESLTGYDYPALLGMKVNPYIQMGEYWRLMTPVMLHGSIAHLAFNMYALFVIGRGLERHYGHLRFAMLYFVAAFCGNVFSYLFSPKASLGASTAIFGLIAAQGIFIYANRFLFGSQARAMLANVIGIVVINLLFGLSPGIDNWGHLGGLIGGLGFAWFAGTQYQVIQTQSGYLMQDTRQNTRAWLVAIAEVAIFTISVFLR